MRRRTVTSLALACAAVAAAAVPTAGATIGYWRFEDAPGFTADSAGGNSLTNSGATQYALPAGSGAGSAFPGTVPLTGAANAKAAQLAGGEGDFLSAGSVLTAALPDMTVEAFFNTTTLATGVQMIASQYDAGSSGTSTGRSWFFGVRDTGQLTFSASTDGTANVGSVKTVNSAFAASIVAGRDYYAAAAFDGGNTEVTFYLKDLTGGGPLLSDVAQTDSIGQVFNSTTALQIGAAADTSSSASVSRNYFTGVIDEVRLSDAATTTLLVVPEPGGLTALGLLALPALTHRRRHQVKAS